MKTKAKPAYDHSSIKQLKGLATVRERPGMWLGDPTSGDALHHCVWEVLDNAVDEALAGHCDTVLVELLPDGWAKVTDNGRGIPVGIHPEEGISTLQMIMASLFSGGKFSGSGGYAEGSAGLHGVGVSAVNAVSEACEVRVWREGHLWSQTYARGVPTSAVTDLGALPKGVAAHTGTEVAWRRDLTIFSGVTEYNQKAVADRLQELAFLNPGLELTLCDTRGKKKVEETWKYSEGIKEFLNEKLGKRKTLTPVLYFTDGHGTEVAMAWTDSSDEEVLCYANNTRNTDGGTHLTGFKNGLTRVITKYAAEHNMVRDLGTDGITGGDIREGIVAVVNLRLKELSFSSQTKEKLVTPGARTRVEALFQDFVEYYLNSNPGVAKKITEKAVLSAKAREAARKARDAVKSKDFSDPSVLAGKLADCQIRDPARREIFIVEGDSAGGSAKMGRDRRFQAILPLRGKILNVEKADIDKILENKEIGAVITALGCGIEQNASFNLEGLKYHQVILMTDADVDGAHIRTLLLTFLYRCMPRLIYEGYVYVAQPPLFGIKQGKKATRYFLSVVEKDLFLQSLDPEVAAGVRLTRYKGLGEMNPVDLWSTTLDPASRVMKQVTVDDAIRAEAAFALLMGDDVDGRRGWIEDNADYATLDI